MGGVGLARFVVQQHQHPITLLPARHPHGSQHHDPPLHGNRHLGTRLLRHHLVTVAMLMVVQMAQGKSVIATNHHLAQGFIIPIHLTQIIRRIQTAIKIQRLRIEQVKLPQMQRNHQAPLSKTISLLVAHLRRLVPQITPLQTTPQRIQILRSQRHSSLHRHHHRLIIGTIPDIAHRLSQIIIAAITPVMDIDQVTDIRTIHQIRPRMEPRLRQARDIDQPLDINRRITDIHRHPPILMYRVPQTLYTLSPI